MEFNPRILLKMSDKTTNEHTSMFFLIVGMSFSEPGVTEFINKKIRDNDPLIVNAIYAFSFNAYVDFMSAGNKRFNPLDNRFWDSFKEYWNIMCDTFHWQTKIAMDKKGIGLKTIQ